MKKVIKIGGLSVNEQIIYESGNGRSNARTNKYPMFTFWKDGVPMDKGEDGSKWAKAVDEANKFMEVFCKGSKVCDEISNVFGCDAKSKVVNYIKTNLSNEARHLVLNEWLNGIDRWQSNLVKQAVALVGMVMAA